MVIFMSVLQNDSLQMAIRRISYIDVAKGLLILFVVFYHNCLSAFYVSQGHNEITNVLRVVQYYMCAPFFMAAFFMLTGYCSNFNKPLKTFLQSLIMTLGAPLFFFDIVPYNLEAFFTMPFKEWIIQVPLSLQRFVRYSLWFLRALFMAKLLYWIINRYFKEKMKFMICIILFIFASSFVLLGYGEHGMHTLFALFFIGIGEKCKKYELFEKKHIGIYTFFLYMLITIVQLYFHRNSPYMTDVIFFYDVFDVILYPLLAISGSLSVICLAKCINTNKALEFLGKYSLVIYCFHMLPYAAFLFGLLLNLIGFEVDLMNADGIKTIIYLTSKFIFTVCLCCILAFILDRPYLRITIGKKI